MAPIERGRDQSGLPPRVAARPDTQQWGLDELMTLAEAAALHWPTGPLTARSLRTAVDDGLLPVVMVARKLLTSRRAIQEMGRCSTRMKPETGRKPDSPSTGAKASRQAAEDAFDRLMRETRLG
ncbi:MAG: hypothetical protein ABSF67_00820 [Roseiarcus sp.]